MMLTHFNIRRTASAVTLLVSLAAVAVWSLPLTGDEGLPGTSPCGDPPAPQHNCGRDAYGRCEEMVANCSGPTVDSWPKVTRCCWSIGTEEYPVVCYPFTGSWRCCRHVQGGPPRWFPECRAGDPQWGKLCAPDQWCYTP